MADNETQRPRRYAVIPTHDRPDHLRRLVAQLAPSCDHAMVVDNASTPPVDVVDLHEATLPHPMQVSVIRDPEQPPNLARLWNVALAEIHEMEMREAAVQMTPHPTWDVAILNDDTELPPGWYDTLALGLRVHDVIAAAGDAYGQVREPIVRRAPDSNLMTRMCPWAFLIRGECGVEADEQLRWWWQDTDIEWRMALAGGVLIMPGLVAANVGANSSTHGVLAEQAAADRRTFAAKWGGNPW